jgi:hypothetical protein
MAADVFSRFIDLRLTDGRKYPPVMSQLAQQLSHIFYSVASMHFSLSASDMSIFILVEILVGRIELFCIKG